MIIFKKNSLKKNNLTFTFKNEFSNWLIKFSNILSKSFEHSPISTNLKIVRNFDDAAA